jgi:hypothetical protein
MSTLQKSLLIADLSGRMSERCSPGPNVVGEIWLRLREDLVIVYWEAWEVSCEEDAEREKSDEPRWRHRLADRGPWAVVRSEENSRSPGRRWQAICELTAGELHHHVKDLAAAFADPTKYDLLLEAALGMVNQQVYDPLARGRFLKKAHHWRQSTDHLFE